MEASKSTGGSGAQGGKTGGGDQVKQGSGSGGAGHGGGDDMMKAPGGEGYIKRQGFENNPRGYFQDLRHGSGKPAN